MNIFSVIIELVSVLVTSKMQNKFEKDTGKENFRLLCTQGNVNMVKANTDANKPQLQQPTFFYLIEKKAGKINSKCVI